MGFEDLEKHLRNFFKKEQNTAPKAVSSRIREQSLRAFSQQKPSPQRGFRLGIFAHKGSLAAFSLVAVFVLFNTFPGGKVPLSAGEIVPKGGLVEVVRDGQIILLNNQAHSLNVGDCIRLGSQAEAVIALGDFQTSASNKAMLCVIDQQSVFLEKGSLVNRGEGLVETSRGVLRGQPRSLFTVSVTESGETKAVAQERAVYVFDSEYRKASLEEGEEVSLRTDTRLNQQSLPKNISLSEAQLNAIHSKLVIARTKALTAVESYLQGEAARGDKDHLSARQSFLSLAQVLDSTRHLQIINRKNLSLLSFDDVLQALSSRTEEDQYIKEAHAVKTLITLVEQNKNRLGFLHPQTGLESFDRYVLLERIFQLAPHKAAQKELLQDRYVSMFLRRIQGSPLKIDQVSTMNEQITILPQNDLLTLSFLTSLEQKLPRDLAQILQEKRQSLAL